METQKWLATIVGAVFTIVGIWGFFANPVLGFSVNVLHNIVHLVLGLLGLYFGLMAADNARGYNKWVGVIYILVALIGFLGWAGFLAVNMADNWLHLVVGVVLAAVGFFA